MTHLMIWFFFIILISDKTKTTKMTLIIVNKIKETIKKPHTDNKEKIMQVIHSFCLYIQLTPKRLLFDPSF